MPTCLITITCFRSLDVEMVFEHVVHSEADGNGHRPFEPIQGQTLVQPTKTLGLMYSAQCSNLLSTHTFSQTTCHNLGSTANTVKYIAPTAKRTTYRRRILFLCITASRAPVKNAKKEASTQMSAPVNARSSQKISKSCTTAPPPVHGLHASSNYIKRIGR